MPGSLDDTILKWALGGMLTLAITGVGWVRASVGKAHTRIDDLKTAEDERHAREAASMREALAAHGRELAEFKEHAWTKFATKDDLEKTETRLLQANSEVLRSVAEVRGLILQQTTRAE